MPVGLVPFGDLLDGPGEGRALALSKEGIGIETGEFGWEILSASDWSEALEHVATGWPDRTYESAVVSCSWPASEDRKRLAKTIERLGVRAIQNGSLGTDAFRTAYGSSRSRNHRLTLSNQGADDSLARVRGRCLRTGC
jgi:hypothetical protein